MKYVWLGLFLSGSLWAARPNFYATQEMQANHPEAFATQPESLAFHQELSQTAHQERLELVKAIRADRELHQNILNFENLSLDRQIVVLRKLFQLECQVLKIVPPELVIDETSIPGWAFFKFDYQTAGPGTVYLNKKKLKEEKNKNEFVMLLLHETRHSAQFQTSQHPMTHLDHGFRAAFEAQSALKPGSFCDFMLLLNEYEAFQFGNYVYGALTGWKMPINDMGTLASQYDHQGQLRMNMLSLLLQTQFHPLELFNQLSKPQYEVMYE